MDYAESVQEYKKQFPVADIVRGWFRAQCADPAARFHLFYRPSAGPVIGALAISTDCPDGFALARPERISPAWTVQHAERFLWESWNALPVLPALKKNEKKTLILWGFHPAHGNTPLKLEEHSTAARKRRTAAGWTCGTYAEGDEPKGLAEQAARARATVKG